MDPNILKGALSRLQEASDILASLLLDDVPDGEPWDDHPADHARILIEDVIAALTPKT